MPEVTEDGRTITKCGACGKTDNAPKLQVAVGTMQIAGETVRHPHDFDGDGCIYYHMDCPSERHAEGGEAHMAIVAAALNGLQNDDLYAHIMTSAGGN